MWWSEARSNQVLPLDDRFGERFAENAERHAGTRTNFTFWSGMGHVPSDVAPDLRSRSYELTAHVNTSGNVGNADGVLIAHGDATCGYSLFVRDGFLVHDLNIGGTHQVVTSDRVVPANAATLGFQMLRTGEGPFPHGVGTLLIDGQPAGSMETDQIFWLMISWSGLDIGLDRGTTVADYDGTGRFMGPNNYTGELVRVSVDLAMDQDVDHDAAGETDLGRE
jgi:arylsulfatase